MTSSYGHVLERQPALGGRLDSPGNLDTLQAKKNFSVSHLLDLEEAGDMVAAQADDSVGEAGRSLLESPGLTSGSDTPLPDSECGGDSRRGVGWGCGPAPAGTADGGGRGRGGTGVLGRGASAVHPTRTLGPACRIGDSGPSRRWPPRRRAESEEREQSKAQAVGETG